MSHDELQQAVDRAERTLADFERSEVFRSALEWSNTPEGFYWELRSERRRELLNAEFSAIVRQKAASEEDS